VSKQAERDYPFKVEQGHLYRKPYDCPRVLREFGVGLTVLRKHLPQGTILDLGCGSGWTSLFLARGGWNVVGVDISERMIEIARERAQRENVSATFEVADVEELDLPRRDFDGVLLFDSLHHCPNYAEVLRRAHDHLRPEGCLLLLEPSWLHRYSPHARATSKQYGVTELGFSRGHLRRVLRRVGFRTVHQYYDPGPCFRGLGGFLAATLRLWLGYLFGYPRIKQIVLAVK
jgi:2-polyprenyl-3-methyl-5-hydroxy-6-metoxy-1,4-benzoquinol methylase